MRVRQVVDRARIQIESKGRKISVYDLLSQLELNLSSLAAKEDWSFLLIHTDPIVKTEVGKRNYPLPEGFGFDFAAKPKVSNGTSEQTLTRKDQSAFFEADFDGSNGFPDYYCVVTNEAGGKELWLEPEPDLATYTIRGLWRKMFAGLTMDSVIPPEVVNYMVCMLVNRYTPDNVSFADEEAARVALYVSEARKRPTHLTPQMEERDAGVEYSQFNEGLAHG